MLARSYGPKVEVGMWCCEWATAHLLSLLGWLQHKQQLTDTEHRCEEKAFCVNSNEYFCSPWKWCWTLLISRKKNNRISRRIELYWIWEKTILWFKEYRISSYAPTQNSRILLNWFIIVLERNGVFNCFILHRFRLDTGKVKSYLAGVMLRVDMLRWSEYDWCWCWKVWPSCQLSRWRISFILHYILFPTLSKFSTMRKGKWIHSL